MHHDSQRSLVYPPHERATNSRAMVLYLHSTPPAALHLAHFWDPRLRTNRYSCCPPDQTTLLFPHHLLRPVPSSRGRPRPGLTRVHTIEELFSRSNTLSIHCPLTVQTRGLVNRGLINLMPEGSILVNTARGAVVDLDAIYEGLQTGRLARAGLDVLPVKPAPEGEDLHPMIRAYREGQEQLKGRLVRLLRISRIILRRAGRISGR